VANLQQCCEYVPHFTMAFISSWVARREFFNKIDEATYKRFAKWGMSILADRYTGVAGCAKGVVMAEPMLTSRKPDAAREYPAHFGYFSWFFEGSTAVFQFLRESIRLDPRVIDARKASILRHVAIKRILYERGAGVLDAGKVNSILYQGYRSRWEYWLGCLPALYFPGLGLVAATALRWRSARGQKAV
jgi:hypothetical protein